MPLGLVVKPPSVYQAGVTIAVCTYAMVPLVSAARQYHLPTTKKAAYRLDDGAREARPLAEATTADKLVLLCGYQPGLAGR